jgi:hypothetical protein
MNFTTYTALFESILNAEVSAPPYNDSMYFDYTRLNQSRMKRWNQQPLLTQEVSDKLNKIQDPQQWIIISEPWCGDAAHIVPVLIQMTAANDLIQYDIQLRDAPPYLIEQYLTNGTKSIPKLIVRNKKGEDLFTWGPRPVGAQQCMNALKDSGVDFESIKIGLQKWYNNDKAVSVCNEIAALL